MLRTYFHVSCQYIILSSVIESCFRIGLSIAKQLAEDGAKVVICSRKQSNVDAAVELLASAGGTVAGISCHVGKNEDRSKLLKFVGSFCFPPYLVLSFYLLTLDLVTFCVFVVFCLRVWPGGRVD